jgi:hypothetical protein
LVGIGSSKRLKSAGMTSKEAEVVEKLSEFKIALTMS